MKDWNIEEKFELDEPAWTRLMELIDRPAVVPDGLRSLFSKPSVFEQPLTDAVRFEPSPTDS